MKKFMCVVLSLLLLVSAVPTLTLAEGVAPETYSVFLDYYEDVVSIYSDADLGDALIIISAYNGNQLVDIELIPYIIYRGEDTVRPSYFSPERGNTVKVSVWDSAENMNELCDPYATTYTRTHLDSNYAVIVAAGMVGGANFGYQVKMFTDKGVMEIRYLADKLKMPSYTTQQVIVTKTDEEAYAIISAMECPIVVSYKLNTAGEITTLALPSEAPFTDLNAAMSSALIKNAEDEFVEVKGEDRETKSVMVGSTTFLMDDATKFIVLDAAAVASNTITVDDFAIYSAEDFTQDQSFENVVVYDSDEDRYASLIFSIDEDIALDSDDLGLVMTKTVTSLNNAEGDSTHRIAGNNAQGAVTYVADPDALSSYTQPKAGELFIPVSFTADDEINKNILVTEITYADSEIAKIALTEEFKNRFLNAKHNSYENYYFGKVNYKKGSIIYFTNELVKKDGGFLAPDYDSAIIVSSTTQVMVYDQTKASKYRVSIESPSYMSFLTKIVDGEYPISDDRVKSYYVLAREYNGVIVDLVYYVFADENLAFEPVKTASLPAVIVEATEPTVQTTE
ncbi:MAG: hypothetical protein PHE51_00565 [Eubacteriales bacterium]|nr:hypothetical protein [Eubacteriales bacterium]